MTRDAAAVLDILKAARLAETFLAGMDRDAFLGDEKTQSAVVHELLIIGEEAKRISEALRTSWKKPADVWMPCASRCG